jgi:hypothetical protein
MPSDRSEVIWRCHLIEMRLFCEEAGGVPVVRMRSAPPSAASGLSPPPPPSPFCPLGGAGAGEGLRVPSSSRILLALRAWGRRWAWPEGTRQKKGEQRSDAAYKISQRQRNMRRVG